MGENAIHSMYLHKTNPNEVSKIIGNLDTKNSSGFDELSARFLQLCTPYIVEPLAYIFNASISTGIYPDHLKIARVASIFKKGSKDDPGNYRPISVAQ